MTPQEALDAIQSRLEAYEVRTHEDMSPEMQEAIDTLAAFIKQVNEHGSLDLEWGEPGECLERMLNDEDERDVINELLVEQDIDLKNWPRSTPSRPPSRASWYYQHDDYDLIVAAAKTVGAGRHYGVPHCIWCLQGD